MPFAFNKPPLASEFAELCRQDHVSPTNPTARALGAGPEGGHVLSYTLVSVQLVNIPFACISDGPSLMDYVKAAQIPEDLKMMKCHTG